MHKMKDLSSLTVTYQDFPPGKPTKHLLQGGEDLKLNFSLFLFIFFFIVNSAIQH